MQCNVPVIGCAKTFFNVDGLEERTVKREFASTMAVVDGGGGGGQNMLLRGESGKVWGAVLRSSRTRFTLSNVTRCRPCEAQMPPLIRFMSVLGIV